MNVTIKLFARMREAVGTGLLKRSLADQATVTDLMEALQQEFPKLAEVDEIALFPPVSGGSGADEGKFAITFEPISLDQIAAKVVRPETGAVAVFGGGVRDVSAGKPVEHLE